MVVRTRRVGLTAAIITAFTLLSWHWPGQEHVGFYEDQVLFGEDLDVQPLHQALHLTEHVYQTMMTGNVVSNL